MSRLTCDDAIVFFDQGSRDKSIEDVFFELDVKELENAFDSQMHFGR